MKADTCLLPGASKRPLNASQKWRNPNSSRDTNEIGKT